MSTYKEIRGLKVRDYTTNPDNPIEGQLWYNTTDNVAKYIAPNVFAAWRTANNLNTTRNFMGAAGTSTSSIAAGGLVPPNSPTVNVETWNGTSWTEVANLNAGRYGLEGAGADSTSAVVFGGFTTPPDATYNNTETWNGSSWTEVNNLNTARFQLAGAGKLSTAALAIGGYTVPPVTAVVESWDGSSWTEVGDLNTARRLLSGNGTTTSAIAYGGWPPK